jgi:type I restriction enzyme, S subunit
MEKQKNIPQLRFPEFQDTWVDEQLSDIATKIGDGIHGTPKYDEEGDYFFINGNNLVEGHICITENTKRINDDEFRIHRRDLNKRTILLSINGTIGNLAYYNSEAVILGKSAAYINIDNNYDLTFLFYSLMTNRIQSYFDSELTGTTIKNLSLKTIRGTKLFIPTLPEQQKIASFFTAIDQKISQLKQKKNLFEKYKLGVMQKIFSQEIRFKDDNGQEFPNWEKKKLREVFSFIGTNSYSRENLNYENGSVKNIHYGDIHTKFASLFDVHKEYVPYINSDINLQRVSDDNYLREGDVIFVDASEDYNDIGKCIEIVNLNHEKVLSGLHTLHARPKESIMVVGFAGQLMKSYDIKLQIQIIAQGTKVLSISTGRLSQIYISFPVKSEQIKIANFLSAIDDKINFTQKQIEKAEIWKKGIMQQIFI